MKKKRVLVHYRKLSKKVKAAIANQYPFGFQDHLIKVKGTNPFHAVLVELEDIVYLVKVAVKKDRKDQLTDDKLFGHLSFFGREE